MQAFDFTGDPYEPVRKPEPTQSKGGFYGFSKNSKSAIVTMSKAEQEQKSKKLQEYRKIIGKDENYDGARQAADLPMANERAIDLALKRANQQSKQLIDVRVQASSANIDLDGPLAEGGENGLIGTGQPPLSRRPETAKPKSLMEAKAIAIKQLLWDEANTVYELDDPPVAASAAGAPQQGKQ